MTVRPGWPHNQNTPTTTDKGDHQVIRTAVSLTLAATIVAAGGSHAGAGTRWSAIPTTTDDTQTEQIVTVGVHPFPGSGIAPGQYAPGAARWADTFAVRLNGATDWLIEPRRTSGPEFTELVIPTGATLDVHWGDSIFKVEVEGCGGPDKNLLDYDRPHLEVPASPLSAGRTSVSVTCDEPTPVTPPTTTIVVVAPEPPTPATPTTTAPAVPPTTTTPTVPPVRHLTPPTVTAPTLPETGPGPLTAALLATGLGSLFAGAAATVAALIIRRTKGQ